MKQHPGVIPGKTYQDMVRYVARNPETWKGQYQGFYSRHRADVRLASQAGRTVTVDRDRVTVWDDDSDEPPDESPGAACECECRSCLSGDCSGCTNAECDSEECAEAGCPMQADFDDGDSEETEEERREREDIQDDPD
ncbi:MAG TPA: hypothetical protein VKR61_26120 [Bryobacteraceae bacterium]|nr:hypothetical protein [Bryobacteraceae bacterium]